jgi:hypothetical protein
MPGTGEINGTGMQVTMTVGKAGLAVDFSTPGD